MRSVFRCVCIWMLFCVGLASTQSAPIASHPRIWLTTNDLPRLRSWAVPSDPMWVGLQSAASQAISTYDTLFYPSGVQSTNWPDRGSTNFELYPSEAYAQFFAFMSLVDPNPTNRVQYAQRARNLLMYAIHEAVKGVAPHDSNGNEVPFRDQFLLTYNRANYWGEAWGTTVDWLQASNVLTPQDLADIRAVFVRWCGEMLSGYNHPLPIGTMNDPQLLADRIQLRAALNNYFTGHMRNIALCALSLDATDDSPINPALPADVLGNTLRSYITNAIGAWLYQQYAVYENSNTVAATFGVSPNGLGMGEGGLSVEGFLYGHAFGYLAEALLALKTAGFHDESLSGPQIRLMTSRFWDDFADGFLHSITPLPWIDPTRSYMGPIYQFASYGDVLRFWITPDHADTFGALGVLDERLGETNRLNKDRWIVQHVIEGGAGDLVSRTANIWGNANASRAILHFLLFDPNAAPAVDVRPTLPLHFHAPVIGRLLDRTDWSTNSSWFNFKCTYISINHQIGDGGQFEFFRKNEWLCKELSGYTSDNLGSCPEFHNTLGIQNTSTTGTNVTPTALQWYESYFPTHGSQWKEGLCAGDPTTFASFGATYTFAYAEMTNLYNRPSSTPDSDFRDVTQANRSIIWLRPDHIVVYDRATTKTANRFKRWFLQFLTPPSINGKLATSTSPNGQKFFVQNLLPQNATLSTAPAVLYTDQAEGEPPTYQLTIEDPSNPSDIRFLHVLQGADANMPQDIPNLVQSTTGNVFEGAAVKDNLVLFPKNVLSGNLTNLGYTISTNITNHFITGLPAYTGYNFNAQIAGNNFQITITPGGTNSFTDSAGVLSFNPTLPLPTFSLTILNGSGSGSYPANASVSITASNAPAGQVFVNWSGPVVNSNSASTIVHMPASNVVVTANFATAFPLTVNNGSGSGNYAAGATVSITANAAPQGLVFDQWTGANVANPLSPTTTLTMPAFATNVTATYRSAPTVTLTVVNGSGSGSHLAGAVVAISANAAQPGQIFDQWTGAAVSNAFSASTTIVVPSVNTTVTATYKSAPVNYYTLTVNSGSGGGSFPAGTTVYISANPPAPGMIFDKWTGATVNSPTATNTFLVMPAADVSLKAAYKSLVTPSWELWADRSNGLVSGGTPSLTVGTNHDIYYTFWNGTPTGVGRVYKNTFALPHTFSLVPTNGFNIDKVVQQNVGDLTLNGAGDPIAAISSTVGSTTSNVNWFYKFGASLNGGAGGWSPATIVANGNYLYNIRIMESDPLSGSIYGVGESPAVWRSLNGGVSFIALDQQGKLPSNLRGGGPPKTREFALCLAPASSRYPYGLVFTAGENNGLVYSADQGTNWASVDPDYLNPISPLARVHPTYDLTIPNQVASGGGDTGGLGWRPDGHILVQSPSAFGYSGNGLNNTSDGMHLYSFLFQRPDLPVLVASGIADNVFQGGQGVQSQTFRTTSSGWTFIESPTFPGGGQGGIYMTDDSINWVNVSGGIGYSMTPRIGGNLSSGGRSSIAVDGDDVFMATLGSIFHFVAPGTNQVAGVVRDTANQPIAGAVVRTTFGQWTLTAADGSYVLTNIGCSIYPISIAASAAGLTFPPQSLTIHGAVTGVNFQGATPVFSSIAVSPTTNTVVAGGTCFFSAIARDQFGYALESQPPITWTASGGVINSNGFFTTTASIPTTNLVTATSGAISGTGIAIGFASTTTPFITSVSPNTGAISGTGTSVVISGGNFSGVTNVLFGGVPASGMTVNTTNNTITCLTPDLSRSPTFNAGGFIPVNVVNAAGTAASLVNGFDAISTGSQYFFCTVRAGTAGGQGQISATAGQILNLVAAIPPSNQVFYAWSGGGEGTFGNITATNTSFIMPAHDVSIVATYKMIPTLPQTAPPVISSNGNTITINCTTTNADIYYTIDGSDPMTHSTTPNPHGILYQGPITFIGTGTIRAIAAAANRPDSAVTQASFTLSPIEAWRAQNFGTNAAINSIAGNDADPDGDGIVNLLEYAFGLNPNSASLTNLPTAVLLTVTTNQYLGIKFYRDTNATDITYTVEVSDDLTNWLQGCSYSGTNSTSSNANTTEFSRITNLLEVITVRDNTPVTDLPKRFIRTKVSYP